MRLRTMREVDIDFVYDFHQDIANRGPYFPIVVPPETVFRRIYTITAAYHPFPSPRKKFLEKTSQNEPLQTPIMDPQPQTGILLSQHMLVVF